MLFQKIKNIFFSIFQLYRYTPAYVRMWTLRSWYSDWYMKSQHQRLASNPTDDLNLTGNLGRPKLAFGSTFGLVLIVVKYLLLSFNRI